GLQLGQMAEPTVAAEVVWRVAKGPDAQRPTLFQVLLDARVAIEDVDGDVDAAVTTLVAKVPMVMERIWRPKTSLTSSGRPRPAGPCRIGPRHRHPGNEISRLPNVLHG